MHCEELGKWEIKLDGLGEPTLPIPFDHYRTDFAIFENWCSRTEIAPSSRPRLRLVAAYVFARGPDHAPASVRRSVAAISRIHQMFDEPDPGKTEAVKMALRRLLRSRGQRQKQAAGLRSDLRDALICACGSDLKGKRDRALISVGYDTLCRRSELVALLAEDVVREKDGSGTVLIRRSKADQLGNGRLAYLSPRSIGLLNDWQDGAGIEGGPIFSPVRAGLALPRGLSDAQVSRIVKHAARAAGLPQALVARLSGHSFRIGAALDMTENGIDLVPIMHAGGWKSPEMVGRYTQQISITRSGMAIMTKGGRD